MVINETTSGYIIDRIKKELISQHCPGDSSAAQTEKKTYDINDGSKNDNNVGWYRRRQLVQGNGKYLFPNIL